SFSEWSRDQCPPRGRAPASPSGWAQEAARDACQEAPPHQRGGGDVVPRGERSGAANRPSAAAKREVKARASNRAYFTHRQRGRWTGQETGCGGACRIEKTRPLSSRCANGWATG